MNRLFVYGIFLDQTRQKDYGMSNPEYSTVEGYLTIGHRIVQAHKTDVEGACLTGLTVDVRPDMWEALDRLERGYDRVEIVTTFNEKAWMYVSKN